LGGKIISGKRWVFGNELKQKQKRGIVRKAQRIIVMMQTRDACEMK
jgi:hypothetical protein